MSRTTPEPATHAAVAIATDATDGGATVAAAAPLDGLALGAALLTVGLWASAFVGIRAVAPDLSPGALAFGRLLIGSLALGLVVVIRRPAMPPAAPGR